MLTDIPLLLLFFSLGVMTTVGGQGPTARRQIEGSGLREKLEAAAARAREDAPRAAYWTAYKFEARPGVAVDSELAQFSGQVEDFAGLKLLFGTDGGRPAETRNLAVFILHGAAGGSVARVEIYNLDRGRGYDGHPVYWLGRVSAEESVGYLRGLAESDRPEAVAGRAAVAIALHEGAGVPAVLRELAAGSPSATARRASIYWLGRTKSERAFLAGLALDAGDVQTRTQAVQAIGLGRDAAALAALQDLYASVTDAEVRGAVVEAAVPNEEAASAGAFLLRIARHDASPELRALAARRLSERAAQHLLETLRETVNNLDTETQLEMERVRVAALGRPKDEAVSALLNIARTHPKAGARVMAIISLGQMNEPRALDLFGEILAR